MTSQSIEQKVRQLDNDVQALYELIHKISTTQGRHTNRLTEITEDLATLKASVAAHDARFDRLESRFDRLESKIDRLESKVDAHDTRFDAHDARFDGLDTKIDRVLELLQR